MEGWIETYCCAFSEKVKASKAIKASVIFFIVLRFIIILFRNKNTH